MARMVADMEEYFRRFVPGREALLLALEQEAREASIPIVGPVVGELLHILARATQAKRILELGTATGYSGIYLAMACDATCGRLVTVERDENMANQARTNFEKAGLKNRVDVRVGDALQELAGMEPPFDFVFMDIDKEDYVRALPHCERLLGAGGLLVTDNVGFEGAGDFNRAIFESPRWRVVPLLAFLPLHSPERDGLSLALRI